MVELHQRSYEPEQMDQSGYSFDDLKSCLQDIAKINRWTDAHRDTIRFVRERYQQHRKISSRPMRVLDVGFGSGDLLRQLAAVAKVERWSLELVGVELNPWSCVIAKELNAEKFDIHYEHRDFIESDDLADVTLSSLLTHHFNDEQFIRFVEKMCHQSRLAWFVHDLHRHVVPYYFIKGFTRCMRLHPMVQFDAPLSVARGFRVGEMQSLMGRVDTEGFSVNIEWKVPFKICASAVRKGLPE